MFTLKFRITQGDSKVFSGVILNLKQSLSEFSPDSAETTLHWEALTLIDRFEDDPYYQLIKNPSHSWKYVVLQFLIKDSSNYSCEFIKPMLDCSAEEDCSLMLTIYCLVEIISSSYHRFKFAQPVTTLFEWSVKVSTWISPLCWKSLATPSGKQL